MRTKSIITCEKCGHKQEVSMPESSCCNSKCKCNKCDHEMCQGSDGRCVYCCCGSVGCPESQKSGDNCCPCCC